MHTHKLLLFLPLPTAHATVPPTAARAWRVALMSLSLSIVVRRPRTVAAGSALAKT